LQIPVLPNFAMTDYASQGKTRKINVVDLNSCRSHMAYYTALSRGATCEGTVIIQGFDDRKITCGASEYLRQEFRELEILDEVTRLSYEGSLPKYIDGNLHNALVRQFQSYKGTTYIPPNVPSQLKWTSSNPMDLLSVITDTPWQIIDKKDQLSKGKDSSIQISLKVADTHNFIIAKGTITNSNSKKRKLAKDGDETTRKKEKN
jgi:hypothetical protein